jgi:hypothetical protein
MSTEFDDLNDAIKRRIMAMADDEAFRQFYTRVGRALAEHHSRTGIQITSSAWKIVVSRELNDALAIYARRLGEKSTALEVNMNMRRIAGIDIVADDNLKGDDIRLRAEIVA